jgi:competence protein ComGF
MLEYKYSSRGTERMVNSPKSAKAQKKAQNIALHRQLQKAKETKRKERRKTSLPAKHIKGKK